MLLHAQDRHQVMYVVALSRPVGTKNSSPYPIIRLCLCMILVHLSTPVLLRGSSSRVPVPSLRTARLRDMAARTTEGICAGELIPLGETMHPFIRWL